MDPIKILGINASPRKRGNSHYLLNIALEAAEELVPGQVKTELFSTEKVFAAPESDFDYIYTRFR